MNSPQSAIEIAGVTFDVGFDGGLEPVFAQSRQKIGADVLVGPVHFTGADDVAHDAAFLEGIHRAEALLRRFEKPRVERKGVFDQL